MPRDQNDPKRPQSGRDRRLRRPRPQCTRVRTPPSQDYSAERRAHACRKGARYARAMWLAKGPRTLSLTGRELPARHSHFLGAPRAQSRKRLIESGYGRHGAPSQDANQSAVQDFGRCAKHFARKRKLGRRSWRRSDRGRSTAGRRRTPIDIANLNTGHPKAADAF